MVRFARARWLVFAAVLPLASAVHSQARSDDNAITQAEDAFGFSVGRETIGIYNANNVRGFSPTAAGNVRINGLYFDPVFGLQSTLLDSASIKVGLSAQGYPFVAPSGIVDQSIRLPQATPGASVIANVDDWGNRGIEVDGSVPLGNRLGVYSGVNLSRTVFPNGTDNINHTESIVARWRPIDSVEIIPFWGMYNDYNDESGTYYIPAGSFIPPVDRPHLDESPSWADVRYTGTNAGILTTVMLDKTWVARLGVFRSSQYNRHAYAFLLEDEQPNGIGDRVLIADPPSDNRSVSGELRISHSIAEGPRLHVIHVSARRRDEHSEFGGSDFVDYGLGPIEQHVTDPMPEFHFGEPTRERVQQNTYGIAYDGRWKNVGEISIGLSKADYRKVTDIPLVGAVTATSSPWLYNGTAAIVLTKAINLYAGYSRGLETNGTAPLSAANRNEPLATILTQQEDAGVRIALTKDLTAVVGVFDLTRPYFGFDTANVYHEVGTVRSRGAEFSVSGKVTPRFNVLFGGVLLNPRVNVDADVQGNIGSKPYGLPTHIINFNGNWQTPFVRGLQLDAGISHRGEQAATVDNAVFLPPRLNVNVGLHYGFKLADRDTTLRLQIADLLNDTSVTSGGPGIYGPRLSRQALGYLTVDL